MYQPQDKVVYGIHGVCVIVGREVRRVDRKDLEYLVLEPIEQPGACYYVPAQNPAALAKLRPLLDRDALTELLHSEEIRRDSWIRDENQRKLRYRELITLDPTEYPPKKRLRKLFTILLVSFYP